MHVIFEAPLLGSEKHIGISNSIAELAKSLAAIGTQLSVLHKQPQRFFHDTPRILEPELETSPVKLPPAALSHSFTTAFPKRWDIPWVVSIFDTIAELYPEVLREVLPKLTPETADLLRRTMHLSAAQADAIIVCSMNTKKDVMHYYDIPEHKIHCIPLAPKPCFRGSSPSEKLFFLQDKGLHEPFFLFVGPRWKHKNFLTALKAFGEFKKERAEHQLLVAVGSSPELSADEHEIVKRYDLQDHLIILPFVSSPEMVLWYNTATALIYPSLYEGFGLPPLEAMACGTPVLASNSSSIPEVTGTAALLFDPNEPEELAELMKKIVYDTHLRETLKKEGIAQSKKFSWQHVAQETLAVYTGLVKKT